MEAKKEDCLTMKEGTPTGTAEHSREIPAVWPGNTAFGFDHQEVSEEGGESSISREEEADTSFQWAEQQMGLPHLANNNIVCPLIFEFI